MIKLSQINFSYQKTQIPALKQVSLEIASGEFIALLGANGSGKSTLCKIISGLLLPQSGKINSTLDCNKIRPLTGLMLANPEDQLVCPLVEEEVAFGLQNLGVPHSTMVNRIEETLNVMGITHLRHQLTHTLSGGEQQKVLIASLLALQPRCLILDEATSFLDTVQQQLVKKTIQYLNKEQGMSIVWSTPSVEDALQADRILVLHQGELVFNGTPTKLLTQKDKAQIWKLKWPDLYILADKLNAAKFPVQLSSSPAEIVQILCSKEEKKNSNNFPHKSFVTNTADTLPLLYTKDLTYKIGSKPSDEKFILDSINISINEGEFLGISGHTGSGKSTLLQHLCGLIAPSHGQVYLKGLDISKNDKRLNEIHRQIGLVFQYPERQFFLPTIEEEVFYGPSKLGMDTRKINSEIEQVFGWLELNYSQLRTRSPHELSGGEKRKLAIACVLMMKPRILILDEPTTGLDGPSKKELLANIHKLHHEFKLTTIMVSHDLTELIDISQKILLLNRGKVHWIGLPQQLLETPKPLTELGFPLPPLWELVHLLKKRLKGFNPCTVTTDSIYAEIENFFS